MRWRSEQYQATCPAAAICPLFARTPIGRIEQFAGLKGRTPSHRDSVDYPSPLSPWNCSLSTMTEGYSSTFWFRVIGQAPLPRGLPSSESTHFHRAGSGVWQAAIDLNALTQGQQTAAVFRQCVISVTACSFELEVRLSDRPISGLEIANIME